MKLTANELTMIEGGGALRYAILAGLGGLIVFLVGVLDGYMNPGKCNDKK